jgi:hypothetical protein
LAWIERRENGWLVRWRDQGKGLSKKFPNEDDAVRFKQTIEEVRLPGTDVRIDEQGYFWAPIRSREAADRAYSVARHHRAPARTRRKGRKLSGAIVQIEATYRLGG